jgi:hypothetical protein
VFAAQQHTNADVILSGVEGSKLPNSASTQGIFTIQPFRFLCSLRSVGMTNKAALFVFLSENKRSLFAKDPAGPDMT